MVIYALLGLVFVLVGAVGLQLTYTFYMERLYKERIKHTRKLERLNGRLRYALEDAEELIARQQAALTSHGIELDAEGEAWADIIDER